MGACRGRLQHVIGFRRGRDSSWRPGRARALRRCWEEGQKGRGRARRTEGQVVGWIPGDHGAQRAGRGGQGAGGHGLSRQAGPREGGGHFRVSVRLGVLWLALYVGGRSTHGLGNSRAVCAGTCSSEPSVASWQRPAILHQAAWTRPVYGPGLTAASQHSGSMKYPSHDVRVCARACPCDVERRWSGELRTPAPA